MDEGRPAVRPTVQIFEGIHPSPAGDAARLRVLREGDMPGAQVPAHRIPLVTGRHSAPEAIVM